MPFPILAAAGLAMQGANLFSQIKTNQKNREFSEHMYNKSRADALADRAFENEYNSPANQMARLKAAGLNPNLIYDQGSAAVAHSANTKQSNFGSYRGEAPAIDAQAVNNSIMMITDLKAKQAQIDNVKNDTLLKLAQIAEVTARKDTEVSRRDLTESQIKKTDVDYNRGHLKYMQERNLTDTVIQTAKEQLRKLSGEATYITDKNEREAALNSSHLREAAERILTMRMSRTKSAAEIEELKSRIKLINQDARIKQMDADLKKMGIQPHDNMFFRWLSEITSPEYWENKK